MYTTHIHARRICIYTVYTLHTHTYHTYISMIVRVRIYNVYHTQCMYANIYIYNILYTRVNRLGGGSKTIFRVRNFSGGVIIVIMWKTGEIVSSHTHCRETSEMRKTRNDATTAGAGPRRDYSSALPPRRLLGDKVAGRTFIFKTFTRHSNRVLFKKSEKKGLKNK